MEVGETFHAATRVEWREWLEANHAKQSEIWLVGYVKSAGVRSVAYSEAVEEALCFGWIDSIRKKLDGERYAQRYTPRRPGSGYSQTNLERLARLIEADRVIPAVVETLGDMRPEDYEIPADIEAALRADEAAWSHWRSFTPAYRRIRAAYVDLARHRDAGEFRKRLENLVAKTAAGKRFGYGIESFY